MRPGARLLWPRSIAGMSIAGMMMGLPQTAWAGDEIKASADVSANGGYSSNPFGGTGSDLGSAYVQIDADPEIRLINERSIFALKGRVNYEHYFHRFSDTADYQGALDYSGTPTSRLATHANASYDSSIVGGFDNVNTQVDPTQSPSAPTTATDLALFGTGTRRRSINVSGDLSYALSTNDFLTANAFFNRSRYGGGLSQSNYNAYGGGAGYSRRMSARLKLGVLASVDRYVYQGVFGNSQVYSLEATVDNQFSSRWTLKGAAGASYSKRTIGGTSLSPTGNLQLCRVSSRSTLCATVTEAVLPSGYAGTVITQSVGASYSYRLSEHADFSVGASYSHNDRPADAPGITTFAVGTSYVTATATYDRTLRERLHFLATTRYRNITGGSGSRSADFGGSIGFAVRLGDYK